MCGFLSFEGVPEWSSTKAYTQSYVCGYDIRSSLFRRKIPLMTLARAAGISHVENAPGAADVTTLVCNGSRYNRSCSL